MNNEDIKAFTYRISQANRTEMVVIIYDIILKDLENAQTCCKKNDEAGFTSSLRHADRFLNELNATLDMSEKISHNLHMLYVYCQKELISARMRLDDAPINNVLPVISALREAFDRIARADTSAPLIENGSSVYAGLTYGKSGFSASGATLTETSGNSENRGILA